MPEDLSVLDQLDAPDDWRTIEQRSPGRLPVGPNNTPRRITAAATAIVVAVAAGTFLVVRFDRSAPLDQTPTPALGACVPGWHIAPKPHTPESTDGLVAASAVSPNDVWAVGTRYPTPGSSGHSEPLIEHWNGQSWELVAGADLGGQGGFLNDVVAIAPNDVWAVGSSAGRDLIEHWDGGQWSFVGSPSEESEGIESIAASGPDDVWAKAVRNPVFGGESVSQDIYEHWDGARWTAMAGPMAVDPSFGSSATQVIASSHSGHTWAAGGIVEGHGEAGQLAGALVERWDGDAWVEAPPPPGQEPISALAVLGDDDIWALTGGGIRSIGAYGGGGSGFVHWDGDAWSHPIEAHGNVRTLVARAADDVWAVGTTESGLPLIEHWDGQHWLQLATGAPVQVSSGLVAASVTPGDQLVVFGSDYPGGFGGGYIGPLSEANNYLWIDCG
jgi:hypothetical protein